MSTSAAIRRKLNPSVPQSWLKVKELSICPGDFPIYFPSFRCFVLGHCLRVFYRTFSFPFRLSILLGKNVPSLVKAEFGKFNYNIRWHEA